MTCLERLKKAMEKLIQDGFSLGKISTSDALNVKHEFHTLNYDMRSVDYQ
jgi:hypothetical protein